METDDNAPRRSKKKPRRPVDPDEDKIMNLQKKTKRRVTPMTGRIVAKKALPKKTEKVVAPKKTSAKPKTTKK